MALVVEDGTGLANSNSYVTESEYETYLDNHGLTDPTGDTEAALVRATSYIDAKYRGQFQGWKVFGRLQALEWPRHNAYDASGEYISYLTIPIELKYAVIEAAIREKTSPGSLMPDQKRAIESIKAGSVSISWPESAANTTTFSKIDGIIAPLISGGSGSDVPITGRLVRA